MNKESLDRFRKWHDLLEEQTPIKEANFLANETVDPKIASAQEIWKVLWDKPLYAISGVGGAAKWKDSITRATKGTKADIHCAWRTWGNPEGLPEVFNIVRREGKSGKGNDCFEVSGEEAECFKRCDKKMPAKFRLFAIQGAAKALRSMDKCSSGPPFHDLSKCCLSKMVRCLKDKFKEGWGDTTVLHALADMNLAVKPDRHLKRTMKELGFPSEDPIKINEAALKMLDYINDSDFPGAPVKLRYLDKVLMDISRLDIIQRAE